MGPVCGEQGGREGGRKALRGLGVSPQEGVMEASLKEGLLMLGESLAPLLLAEMLCWAAAV